MSVEIKRTNSTVFRVETQATGNHLTTDHFLWMAKQLQEAVDAGMPTNTEVTIRNESGVNGVTISARGVLSQDIT